MEDLKIAAVKNFQKKTWKAPEIIFIGSSRVNNGLNNAYKESTILGSQVGPNPITFTLPVSKGGHAYSRSHTKMYYHS